MSQYRRLFVPGGTYFFSVHLQDPRAGTLVSHVDVLRQSVRLARKRWPFVINAAVVLPSVTHMIWTLPEGDADFSKRWRLIKSTFSRHVPAPAYVPPAQARRGEKGIWQRRFWEHLIRDRADFHRHMRLIADAPKTKGLVREAAEWPYSSFSYRRAQEGCQPQFTGEKGLRDQGRVRQSSPEMLAAGQCAAATSHAGRAAEQATLSHS